MGCGCNKSKGAVSFVHTADDGKRTETRTEIEARALVVRKGGSYEVKR